MKPAANAIAGIAIAFGIVAIFLPAVGGMVSGTGAVNRLCDTCAGGCTEQDRMNATNAMNALGIIIAYIGAMGWSAIICGIVASSLGCCICCKCCKMKDDLVQPAGASGAIVVGQVAK